MAKKTTCSITRGEFRGKAKPVAISIAGQNLQADAREFSTGSLGWYLNGKTMVDVGGTMVQVQIGLNLTIVGSKDLPAEAPAHAAHPAPATPAPDTAREPHAAPKHENRP